MNEYHVFISTVKDMPIKRLEHNIDKKKKKTTNSVQEFQKVSKALCHTGMSSTRIDKYQPN